MGLDPVLLALANCPVIEQKETGGKIVYNPTPVISASNDYILAHEICHKLSGKESYDKFITSCIVRNNQLFSYVLNILVDWWDELRFSHHSMYLFARIKKLRESMKVNNPNDDPILGLFELFEGKKPTDFPDVTCIEDLIVYADRFVETNKKYKLNIIDYLLLCIDLEDDEDIKRALKDLISGDLTPKLGASSELVEDHTRGNYYLSTVSKYNNIIEVVTELWTKNKYKLTPNYYGEINWKKLPQLMMGEAINLPIFNIFRKVEISRNVHIAIDRSGSTSSIKCPIMDTAIILAESFRRCKVPVSILDVGHTNTIVNKISDPLDFGWFVPLSSGGTPLGKVCSLIKNSSPEDYLIIVTDGEPDNWAELKSAISSFKGSHLSFIIGNSFKSYYQQLNGKAVSVEPTTIIRTLINDSTLTT